MNIADDKGLIYQVQKPEEVLITLSNDELMAILKCTYIAMRWNEDMKVLVDGGTIESTEDHDDLIAGLSAGVEFIKNHLALIFNPDDIEAELKIVRGNMYNRKGVHDN